MADSENKKWTVCLARDVHLSGYLYNRIGIGFGIEERNVIKRLGVELRANSVDGLE